mmetsp:Transcript_77714/g.155636  ORF Transcript_77714/g.155636 Transcript_77714/m.155636 type:complete len:82 (-) Transcript_77714:2137-2382(-)
MPGRDSQQCLIFSPLVGKVFDIRSKFIPSAFFSTTFCPYRLQTAQVASVNAEPESQGAIVCKKERVIIDDRNLSKSLIFSK